MSGDFLSRLVSRIRSGMGPAVVGLDPRLDALPVEVTAGRSPAAGIAEFYRRALPRLARHVPAVKPNIAFFECHGAEGFSAYETTCTLARESGLVVIGDVKRGDIGSTAAAYAAIHLDLADAVTVHPYLGTDATEPFLARCRTEGKGLFVLVRTSNPSADELQDLHCGDRRLCEVVAALVDRWNDGMPVIDGHAPVGAVVGATRPHEVARLRARMPRSWLLLPGVGAQGGSIEDCAAAFDHRGLGGLVSQSRSVMQCFGPGDPDWLEQIEAAAAAFSDHAAAAAGDTSGESRP